MRTLITICLIAAFSSPTIVAGQSVSKTKINKFIGTWKPVDRGIPFSASLEIRRDNTYSYWYGACMSGGNSKGTWTYRDGEIILNSQDCDKCMHLSNFASDCISRDSARNYKRRVTQNNCIPKGSFQYLHFENETFGIINKTLIHEPSKEKLCPKFQLKFIRKRILTIAQR
ncbi:MAG: hypothetical protein HRT71_09515 [Flavobacteriales bacterium]|nr:hypothetical protein [Flavobacteriales bacterium]